MLKDDAAVGCHNHGGRSRSEGDALGRKKPFVFVWVPGRLEVPEVTPRRVPNNL